MHVISMSNPVVRIATVNIVLAGVFALLVYFELSYFPVTAGGLAAIATLTNVILLLRRRRQPTGKRPGPGDATESGADSSPASLGRVRSATEAERRPPRPAGRHESDVSGEMPSWLRMKGNIVMNWNGKHHVAPINGDDPFDVAQRLYEHLRRSESASGAVSAGEREAASRDSAGRG